VTSCRSSFGFAIRTFPFSWRILTFADRVALADGLATPDAPSASHRCVLLKPFSLSRASDPSGSRPLLLGSLSLCTHLLGLSNLAAYSTPRTPSRVPYISDIRRIKASMWYISVHVPDTPQEDMRWYQGHIVDIILIAHRIDYLRQRRRSRKGMETIK